MEIRDRYRPDIDLASHRYEALATISGIDGKTMRSRSDDSNTAVDVQLFAVERYRRRSILGDRFVGKHDRVRSSAAQTIGLAMASRRLS